MLTNGQRNAGLFEVDFVHLREEDEEGRRARQEGRESGADYVVCIRKVVRYYYDGDTQQHQQLEDHGNDGRRPQILVVEVVIREAVLHLDGLVPVQHDEQRRPDKGQERHRVLRRRAPPGALDGPTVPRCCFHRSPAVAAIAREGTGPWTVCSRRRKPPRTGKTCPFSRRTVLRQLSSVRRLRLADGLYGDPDGRRRGRCGVVRGFPLRRRVELFVEVPTPSTP